MTADPEAIESPAPPSERINLTTLFFGERWDAPIVDEATPTPTPVGKLCYQCSEPVENGDRGFIRTTVRMGDDGKLVGSAEPVHAECDMSGVIGHQVGVCHCTGYDGSRATAKLVWQRAGEQCGRPLEEFPPKPPRVPCPEGFHWIGQSFAHCDKCGLPAWEHEGMATARRPESPWSFEPDDQYWVLKPWAPGEREACRRKWDSR